MLELPKAEWYLLAAITLLTGVLAAKLFYVGLAGRYRAFTVFLVFSVARVVVMGVVKMDAAVYRHFYIGTELVQLVLYVSMVVELYRLVFEQYTGIRNVAVWTLRGALAVALVISFLSLSADMGGRKHVAMSLLDGFMMAERGVISTLVLVLVAMTGFLAYFPITLPVNLVVHSGVFAVYFLSKSALILYRNVVGTVDRGMSLSIMVLAGMCLCTWIVLLRRRGEALSKVVGRPWNRSEEERLIAQLKGVNSALARMTRE
ncbi:MAG: hypothetical protein JNK48_28745 [Bryobacterales bacterium]|nr:hypothetical protein [Bryobacterales bacterium]